MLASSTSRQSYTPSQSQLVADTDHVRALEIERELEREPIWWGMDLGSEPWRMHPDPRLQDVYRTEAYAQYAKFEAEYTRMMHEALRPGLMFPRGY